MGDPEPMTAEAEIPGQGPALPATDTNGGARGAAALAAAILAGGSAYLATGELERLRTAAKRRAKDRTYSTATRSR